MTKEEIRLREEIEGSTKAEVVEFLTAMLELHDKGIVELIEIDDEIHFHFNMDTYFSDDIPIEEIEEELPF